MSSENTSSRVPTLWFDGEGDTLDKDTLELLRDPVEQRFPPVPFFQNYFLLSLKLKYISFWVIIFYNAKQANINYPFSRNEK